MKKVGAAVIAIGLLGIASIVADRLAEAAVISSHQRIGLMGEVALTLVGLALYLWPETKP
jgi:hypothetical protein